MNNISGKNEIKDTADLLQKLYSRADLVKFNISLPKYARARSSSNKLHLARTISAYYQYH